MSSSSDCEPFDRNRCSYKDLQDSKDYIQSFIAGKYKPKIGIVCGTGLGSLADVLENTLNLPFEDIPHFSVSTVAGHVGQLVFGTLSDIDVVCMQGRIHYYEGYPLWKCVIPIRVMKLLGVEFLIISNAAGGLNENFSVGDVMLIKDHLNLMAFAGNNPLCGPNDEAEGPRFVVMNQAYDEDLILKAKQIWKHENLDGRLFDGVYSCVGGPNFETVAEVKMLKLVGVDAVGMSTVHEVLTARHCGMHVLAFSIITNICVINDFEDNSLKHTEVMDVGKMREDGLKKFIVEMINYIAVNSEWDYTQLINEEQREVNGKGCAIISLIVTPRLYSVPI
ncbi:hypothetical protein Trydic_g15190 [Trypoxylus dichotomus]